MKLSTNWLKEITPGIKIDNKLIESLTSQAAVALNNTKLLNDLEALFNSLVQYTVKAIDARSPHTAGHSSRVAKLTVKLAKLVDNMKNGKYKDIQYTKDQLHEIWISGLVHDVGKIATPTSILDKRNKLDGAKFDLVLQRMKQIRSIIKFECSDAELENKLEEWKLDFEFLNRINKPGWMSDEDIIKLKEIYSKTFFDGFDKIPYLTEEEFELEASDEKPGSAIQQHEKPRCAESHGQNLLSVLLRPYRLPDRCKRHRRQTPRPCNLHRNRRPAYRHSRVQEACHCRRRH